MFWVIEVRALELRSWAALSVGVKGCALEGEGDEDVCSSAVVPLEGDIFAVMRRVCAVIHGCLQRKFKCSLSYKQIY